MFMVGQGKVSPRAVCLSRDRSQVQADGGELSFKAVNNC
jgi:hypothetical protein